MLGHSLDEIADATGSTVPAVKASLSRGRANLRARAQRDATPWRDRPETTVEERALVGRYVSLFNARDWEGVKAMLLEECRLELVGKSTRRGKAINLYFTNIEKDRTPALRGRPRGGAHRRRCVSAATARGRPTWCWSTSTATTCR